MLIDELSSLFIEVTLKGRTCFQRANPFRLIVSFGNEITYRKKQYLSAEVTTYSSLLLFFYYYCFVFFYLFFFFQMKFSVR